MKSVKNKLNGVIELEIYLFQPGIIKAGGLIRPNAVISCRRVWMRQFVNPTVILKIISGLRFRSPKLIYQAQQAQIYLHLRMLKNEISKK